MDLTKPKKEKKELSDFEEKLLKEISSHLKAKFEEMIKKMLKKFDSKFKEFYSKYEKKLLTELEKSNLEMNSFCTKIETLEETFLLLYTQIKQNQFLYANYPEEWIKEVNEKIKKSISE